MSQSDYIKFKKTSRILQNQADFDPILAPSVYMTGMDFNLETTVFNTKQTNNQLRPPDKQIVFGIERTIGGNCPTFTLCMETNTRANRRALDAVQSTCFPVMKAPGRSVPPVKPNFNSYVRKNYRIRCECNHTTCIGSQSRTCRLKYGCTCIDTAADETPPVAGITFFSLGKKYRPPAGFGKTV